MNRPVTISDFLPVIDNGPLFKYTVFDHTRLHGRLFSFDPNRKKEYNMRARESGSSVFVFSSRRMKADCVRWAYDLI